LLLEAEGAEVVVPAGVEVGVVHIPAEEVVVGVVPAEVGVVVLVAHILVLPVAVVVADIQVAVLPVQMVVADIQVVVLPVVVVADKQVVGSIAVAVGIVVEQVRSFVRVHRIRCLCRLRMDLSADSLFSF